MKAGVGARLAEKAATTIGSKAKRRRNGLIGPPMPTPVRTGRLTRLPLGRANCACLARMKDMARSTSHGGTRRHSRTARTQAGESRSKALLWSMRSTARPPRAVGQSRHAGGSQASATGPRSAAWRPSLG
eukprot:1794252-Alexandrium_andersonii.AAC.1